MEMEMEMEMDGLEALLLSGCSELEHIPEFGENMKRLEDLYLDGTKIKRLPESLGKMRSLRKLDVSETAIEELPSFLLRLERLRLFHIHGCRLLSLTRTFHSMELSLLGLKELDLSACNLSTIPDGIGLLYSLKELDLSKNDFVTLPASISLLSNLRMLCLNSCIRLESLPKLSKVNEDTLLGLEIRFSHYISGGELDVSKFHSPSHDINPTVSCLNCPKLIENQSGRGVADTIFQKYLQVRTESRVIPEAIFEIVAAGSEIPWGFKLGRSPPVILKGIETKLHGLGDVFDFDYDFYTCIGVALCAVIVVPHPLDNIEVKYEVVAHIHVAGKCWRIPIPVNFLDAELETQLVWYWSVTDDFRRAVDPNEMIQFEISFSVEPEDGNLEVKKFGLRFLHRGDVERLLRGPRIYINGISSMKMILLFCGQKMRCRKEVCEAKMRWYKEVCEANQELQSLNSSFQDHTCTVTTILATGFKHGSISLDSIHEVIESLLEMNKEVVKVILERKEEIQKDEQLFSLVIQFFKMSLPMLELCTDFMKFLKGSGDSLLIVQVAMKQIEAKRRAGTLNYLETVQQLIDLEAAMVLEGAKVSLSADFIPLFQSLSDGRATLPWDYADQKMRNTKSTSVKAWRKVSHVTTAATLSAVLISTVVTLRSGLLEGVTPTMKFAHGMRTLFDEWLAGYEYKSLFDEWLTEYEYESWDEGYGSFMETDDDEDQEFSRKNINDIRWEKGMRITDFDGIRNLLEELKIKMGWLFHVPDSVAKEDERSVILMEEIKERISGFRNAIEVMSMNAYERIISIRQASTEALLSNYETESSNAKQKGEIHEHVLKWRGLRVSIYGIPIIMEMISKFCSQKLRMWWYKEVCEANQELQSLNLSFQDHTCKVINILTSGFKHGSISLDSIREVIESLLEMNQEVVKVILECKEEILKEWTLLYFVRHFFKMSVRMLELYTDFMKSLKGSSDSWLIVQVAMQQIEAKRRAGTLNYSETMRQLIHLEAVMVLEGAKVPLSADFNTLFNYISGGRWDYAVQKIHETKSPSVEACKVSLVTTATTLSTVLISAVVALRSALSPTVRGTMNFVHGMRTLFDEWLAGYEYIGWDEGYGSFREMDKDFEYETSLDCYFKYESREKGLTITDFDGILELLEELKSKMELEWLLHLSDSVAKEEEIVILMDEIKMRISGFTNTIEHMSNHAYERIHYLRQAATVLQSNYEVESDRS